MEASYLPANLLSHHLYLSSLSAPSHHGTQTLSISFLEVASSLLSQQLKSACFPSPYRRGLSNLHPISHSQPSLHSFVCIPPHLSITEIHRQLSLVTLRPPPSAPFLHHLVRGISQQACITGLQRGLGRSQWLSQQRLHASTISPVGREAWFNVMRSLQKHCG